jgi:HSP20 family protein
MRCSQVLPPASVARLLLGGSSSRGRKIMAEKTEKTEKTEKEAAGMVPWRPFAEFERWPSLWEGFPSLFGESLFPRMGRLFPELERRSREFLPLMDVTETDAQYTITVELPGIKKEDVQVELREGMLMIRGEKKSEREEKKERSRYVERTFGSFSRSFTLPPDADPDRVQAAFNDGVLTLTVPRTEESKPRQIAIKS